MTKAIFADPPKNTPASIFRETLCRISPVLATKVMYLVKFKRPLDLKNPRTLNEKVCWLKLNTYKNNPLITQCADKYAVREYVKSKGLESSLNDLIGVWDSVDEIPWEDLPDQFVIKCNHGCGFNIIVPDKSELSYSQASKALSAWMKVDYWLGHAEPQYKDIPKKIICEIFLSDGSGQLPRDYKFLCFNGVMRYVSTIDKNPIEKSKLVYYFDREWNLARLNSASIAAEGLPIARPEILHEMIQYAETLAQPFPYVRVDFYVIGDRIVFGELTFTPSAGLSKKRLLETDLLLGSLLTL